MPIFDQGYQHWNGQLAGQTWRWLVITRQGLRAGMKNIIVRGVLLLAWIPAVALSVFLCIWGLLERQSDLLSGIMPILRLMGSSIVSDPKHYRLVIWTICFDRFLTVELYFSIILILLMGPNLISQDLRFNALPLYLSRPLRRIDYFLGKLGIVAALIAMVMIVPSIIAYLLGLLLSLDITIVRDTYSLLLACILYGAILAVSAGLLILALSALSRNSRYVALFWIGLLLLGFVLWQTLDNVAANQRRRDYYSSRAEFFQRPPRGLRGRGDRKRQDRIWFDQFSRMQEELDAQELAAAKTDWRPLLSYSGNLARLREGLLNTNAQWETLASLQPGGATPRFRLNVFNPSFPLRWSTIVLLSLFGLSTWILNVKVRSLDRLK